MRVLNEYEINELIDDGSIQISSLKFLDPLRIGLSLESICLKAPLKLDIKNPSRSKWDKFNLYEDALKKNEFYLGFSKQIISLPNNLIGFMHGKSEFARLGLNFLNSSYYVSPGFGNPNGNKIAFEISTKIEIKLSEEHYYVGLSLFEISQPILNKRNYNLIFPFNTTLLTK